MLGIVGLSFAAPAAEDPPSRIIHLWVDPTYGNDSLAAGAGKLNPNAATPVTVCTPPLTPRLPLDVRNSAGAPLLHAPWPFRTITAAIAYLRTNSPNPPGTPPLPYISNGSLTASAAIIHLLPGLYMRAGPGVPDTHTGFDGNGETFPIHLPRFVSIRGASALNTVFLANLNNSGSGPFFEFGVYGSTGTADPIDGIGCFIDKVAMVGTRGGDGPTACAVAILGGSVLCRPTITNCLFLQNGAGVMVAAPWGGGQTTIGHHGTTIINNTFVANYCGLWNGQLEGSQPPNGSLTTLTRGVSRLIVVNNIFDSSVDYGSATNYLASAADCAWQAPSQSRKPGAWGVPGMPFLINIGIPPIPTDFAGVDRGDLVVASPFGGLYNACNYDFGAGNGNFNNDVVYTRDPVPGLPVAAPRTTNTIQPVPALNLARYTGWANNAFNVRRRGTLFIRDLYCNGTIDAPTNFPASTLVTFDQSPMDFRLSPRIGEAVPFTSSIPNKLTLDSPLIDSGWAAPITPAAPLVMQNGQTLQYPPGYIAMDSASQGTWSFSCWDEDGEGYGNARVVDYAPIGNSTATPPIDIGFDEVDGLIVTGQRAMTTWFISGFYSTGPKQNQYLTYIGYPGPIAPGNSLLPRFRGLIHQSLPPTYNAAAYGPAGFHPWVADRPPAWSAGSLVYYVPTVTDIVPHLMPDYHPWWHLPGVGIMGSPSNPVWEPCIAHNFTLYADPTADVINPPGARPDLAWISNFEWLDEFPYPGPATFVPFGPYGGGPPTIGGFSDWCVGGTGPGVGPYFDTLTRTDNNGTQPGRIGVRVSIENDSQNFYGSAARNIQSFHILRGRENQ